MRRGRATERETTTPKRRMNRPAKLSRRDSMPGSAARWASPVSAVQIVMRKRATPAHACSGAAAALAGRGAPGNQKRRNPKTHCV